RSSLYWWRTWAIVSGVARSPRSACAGEPGSARIQTKTRIETPSRIGTSSRSRRTTYLSISSSADSYVRLGSREVHRRERLERDRARRVPVHPLLEGEGRLRVHVRHHRQELHHHDRGLLVEQGPLGQVRLGVCPPEQVEERRVVEAELVVLGTEVHVQEVRRVTEVARPPEQVELGLAALHLPEVVGAPRSAVERDLEARLLEAGAERLRVPLRVRHVRPRDARRVPEVDRDRQVQPGLVEAPPPVGRVVRVLRHTL